MDLIPAVSGLTVILDPRDHPIAEINRQIDNLALSKSPLTRKEYQNACREFIKMKYDDIKSSQEGLTLDHLESYIGDLKARGIKQATITKKLSGLSAFFDHLVKRRLLRENMVKLLGRTEKKRGRPKPTATLKSWQVRAIFDSLDPKSSFFYFHRAILGVGFYAGLRSAEIRSLKYGNIIRSEGYMIIRVKIKHHMNDEHHTIPVHPVLKTYLDEYFSHQSERGIDIFNQDKYLFTCRKPGFSGEKQLSSEGLNYIFQKAINQAGIERDGEKRYSPHCMRRSMGNNMEEKNVPLFRIQKAYGHASADTTVGYLDREEAHADSAVWAVRY